MRKTLLLFLLALFTVTYTAFAQGGKRIVTGKLLDAQTKDPLIGATVLVKGTTAATSVSLDGTFKISVPDGSNTLVLSYIGYLPKEVEITGASLGVITLDPTSSAIKEVTVVGDIAIDRKTPVAVTTVNQHLLEQKIGIQDIPSVLNIVPGVYASNTTGYGDTRLSIRGFSSTAKNGNVALTINGIPVNDMESGNTYWSDFTGLSDVTTSVQVQRGLGASKIIVPSFGGTINITTRSTDAEKGGYVFEGIGSDGYNKTGVLVSTGLTNNGWAATFQGSRTSGNFYADNTQFLNYNYFFNLSKVLTPSQTLSFSIMGANQHHNTRYQSSIQTIRNAPQGIRYNPDAGVLNGEPYDPYQNYYSKPLLSLNHSWVINSRSSLSTVLYATYGTGAGVSLVGTAPRVNGGTSATGSLSPNGAVDYSPIDLTAVEKNNASATGSAANYLKAAENDHHWYGARSTYDRQLTDNIHLSAGVDLRYYEGIHYTKVYNLLGGSYVVASSAGSTDVNDPTKHNVTNDKINYYNIDKILSGGAYAQAEYTKNNLSVFLTLSGSDSRDQRNDYFNYKDGDPDQHSPWQNFFTYQAKGGANYNLNDNMNVFANIGYITKPPYFDNVFINFKNDVNKNTVLEKLFSYELGYQFKTSAFSAIVNLYRSNYMDRAFTQPTLPDATGNIYSINLSGINEMHQGGELELKFKPVDLITLNGSVSIGDWYYTKNTGPTTVTNDSHAVVGTYQSLYIKGIKVGDQPQTQTRLGVDLNLLPDFQLSGDWFYNANYTSNFYFNSVNTPGLSPWKIPNFNLINLNAVFKFKFAGFNSELVGNVYNLFNTKYISDSIDGSAGGINTAGTSLNSPVPPKGTPQGVNVYYGYGRTFGTSLKIKF